MGGERETALASSTYLPFTRRLLIFTGWNWKCHVIIVIKTDLSGFVVPMHSGLCEQYVKSLGLRPRDLTSCFARALVHWDNKPLQNRSYSLNQCMHLKNNLDYKISSYWNSGSGLWVPNCVVPTDTWRNNSVIITSKRRFDVIPTLIVRRVPPGVYHLLMTIRHVYLTY